MSLKNKRVLVTGADGFIGSHLTETLIRLGCSTKAVVLYNSFNSWGWLDESSEDIKKELNVFAGDIRDPYGMRKALQGCDLVFHLAALVAIPYSYHSPETYIDTNIKGTLNVLQAARDLGVGKIVHTSTSEVYGTARYVPIDEEHPLQGQSPYSATKIAGDQIALSFYRSFDTPVAIARPFNTYGPRQSARAVIPAIITQIAAGQKELQLGSLHPTRDFNYVEDTVKGFIAVAESEETLGEEINIGSNYEVSIGAVVDIIAKLMQADIEVKTDDHRLRPEKSEVGRLWADNQKALRLTGWQPQYAGIEGLTRGLGNTIDWFCDPRNLKGYKTGIYNI
ncbi:MAG: NAD-dependent 4,6-dehydratase LegB [Ignavibacteriales bacterium]